MDLKQLNLEQLKSLAYDQVVAIEQAKHNLQIIQQEITKKSEELKSK